MPRKSRNRKRQSGSDAPPADAKPVQGNDRVDTTKSASVAFESDQHSVPDQSTHQPNELSTRQCGCPGSESGEPIPGIASESEQSIIGAVDANTQLLQHLLEQVSDLRQVVHHARREGQPVPCGPPSDDNPEDAFGQDDSHAGLLRERIEEPERIEERERIEEPERIEERERIEELERQVNELEQQNSDLAAQVASSSVRQTVSDANSSCNDALSWEERKELILKQMEDDTFDAAEFVSTLHGDSENADESPADFVDHLHAELEKRDAEIARREEELQELRFLLDQQSETRDSGVAIGAAAIAEMIDSDELVQQERERLQLLQAEWEEKFRQGEIEASLERAKLSRERQELGKKQAELEEQLEHIRRESRQTDVNGSSSSRRWLVKLGLAESD